MKKVLIAAALVALLFNLAKAQSLEEDRINLIKAFLHDVHETDIDVRKIREKYISFNQKKDGDIEGRYELSERHIDYMRQGDDACELCEKCQNCKIIFKDNQHRILRYSNLLGVPHANFDRLEDQVKNNIYAVIEEQKVLQYFFFHDGKIASFYYFEKDDVPFFLFY